MRSNKRNTRKRSFKKKQKSIKGGSRSSSIKKYLGSFLGMRKNKNVEEQLFKKIDILDKEQPVKKLEIKTKYQGDPQNTIIEIDRIDIMKSNQNNPSDNSSRPRVKFYNNLDRPEDIAFKKGPNSPEEINIKKDEEYLVATKYNPVHHDELKKNKGVLGYTALKHWPLLDDAYFIFIKDTTTWQRISLNFKRNNLVDIGKQIYDYYSLYI